MDDNLIARLRAPSLRNQLDSMHVLDRTFDDLCDEAADALVEMEKNHYIELGLLDEETAELTKKVDLASEDERKEESKSTTFYRSTKDVG